MPTTVRLPSGDTLTLADDEDGEDALDKIVSYAEEEAKRLSASAEKLEQTEKKLEAKREEASAAKDLLVDEVCRRKALSEDSFDPSEDRDQIAALSMEEIEQKLDGLPAAPDSESALTKGDTNDGDAYAFAE